MRRFIKGMSAATYWPSLIILLLAELAAVGWLLNHFFHLGWLWLY
jgi:hypothetical protein